ncbi:DinB family protein [Alteribacter lacisalsi]|nr:DinB family protein [Alteribacter lacisalsi]
MSGALKACHFWRERLTQSLEAADEELACRIPDGFSNNIKWNAGHILVNFYEKTGTLADRAVDLPADYQKAFSKGTSPEHWADLDVPELTRIIALLKEQAEWLDQQSEQIFTAKLEKSFRGMDTGEELVQFLTAHDCLHLGVINSIKNASNVKNVWG